jgi:hypothetical protein
MQLSKVVLFVSWITLVVLSSCENDQSVTFRFTNLDLDHVDSSPGLPVLAHDSVKAAVYGVRLYLYPVEISRKGRHFDPYEAPPVNQDPITVFNVWSNAYFNGTPPGTSLNNHFILFQGSYTHVDTLHPNAPISPTARYHDDFEKNNFPDYVDILLLDRPATGNYKFYVEMHMQNGGVFKDSTTSIKLY